MPARTLQGSPVSCHRPTEVRRRRFRPRTWPRRRIDGVKFLAQRRKETAVRIEVRGRNVEVTEELREHVTKRFARTARQVSELAQLEVELLRGAQPLDRRPLRRRGDPLPEGRDAARPRRRRRRCCTRSTSSPRTSAARSSAIARSAAGAPAPAVRSAAGAAERPEPRPGPAPSQTATLSVNGPGNHRSSLAPRRGAQAQGAHERRVEAINRYEPEMELLDDGEIRAHADELRAPRPRGRRDARRSCCPRRSRSAARPASGRSASATTTSS